MKNTVFACVFVTPLVLVSFAQSVVAAEGYVNYRHQYLDDSKLHSDRFLIGARLANGLGFHGELKYKTAGSREGVAFDNTVGSGHELVIDYRHVLNPKWALTPFVRLDSVEEATTYSGGLRVDHRIHEKVNLAGRYRYEARKLDRDKVDATVPDRARQDQHINRFDGWLTYMPGGKWTYEYNFVYFDTDYVRFDNKKKDYENNLAFKYQWNKNWQPFFEVGDIRVNSTEDDRQLRLRVGVNYKFD
jgi:opacity protein-like surface antigen